MSKTSTSAKKMAATFADNRLFALLGTCGPVFCFVSAAGLTSCAFACVGAALSLAAIPAGLLLPTSQDYISTRCLIGDTN